MFKLAKRLTEIQIVRFVIIGGVNTLIGISYYYTFLLLFSYQIALTLAYVFGVSTSYVLNSRFVFHKTPTWKGLLQFPIVYIIQYVVSLLTVSIAVEAFGFDERIAFLFGVVLTIPFTFIASRFIIRRANR